jgi:hypothetical protein
MAESRRIRKNGPRAARERAELDPEHAHGSSHGTMLTGRPALLLARSALGA